MKAATLAVALTSIFLSFNALADVTGEAVWRATAVKDTTGRASAIDPGDAIQIIPAGTRRLANEVVNHSDSPRLVNFTVVQISSVGRAAHS